MGKSTIRFLAKRESVIAEALNAIRPKTNFSIRGHGNRQRNSFKILRNSGRDSDKFGSSVHQSFKTINKERHSLACVCEQSRARLAMVSYVFPILKKRFLRSAPTHFVTIVLPTHHRDPGNLHTIEARTILRKFDDGMRDLCRNYRKAIGVGVLEIAAYEGRNGSVQFHPHVHALVSGPSREEILEVFKVRKSPKQPPRNKPVQANVVKCVCKMAYYSLYMTKFKPEHSSPYETEDGKKGRSNATISPDMKAEWLDWMADYTISEVFSIHGLSRARVDKLYGAEMETVVKRFLKETDCKHSEEH